MQRLAQLCEAISSTTKKTEKTRLLAAYFSARRLEESAISAIFLSGRPFAAYEEATLQIGGTILWRVVEDLAETGHREVSAALSAAYKKHGDLGAAAYDVLAPVAPRASTLNVLDIEGAFREIAAASGAAAKAARTAELLRQSTALEAKYILKIVTGDLRIGLRESLVEDGIAAAFEVPAEQVRRANMLIGDIGQTLRLAAAKDLAKARMRLFHPIAPMLASAVETAEEAFECFDHALVEDKFDGIRAQVHCGGPDDPRVRIFSRTMDDVTGSFPELLPWLQAFPEPLVLDGEVLAWDFASNRALPFSALQKRLGRKVVSQKMQDENPVAYMVFDVLHAGGSLVIDQPLEERIALLQAALAQAGAPAHSLNAGQQSLAFEAEGGSAAKRILQSVTVAVNSAEELDRTFELAQARGNEGLMIKERGSAYTPGRRGRSWLKLKRELATLDVVVTAAEYGHGKRAGILSDVTFAVREGDELRNIGKAYSGLTDAEIQQLSDWFHQHTLTDNGWTRMVEPEIVLEIAFNAIMQSGRHNSGYALRFPRILRIRADKKKEEIDTLERVREIFERQHKGSLRNRPHS